MPEYFINTDNAELKYVARRFTTNSNNYYYHAYTLVSVCECCSTQHISLAIHVDYVDKLELCDSSQTPTDCLDFTGM